MAYKTIYFDNYNHLLTSLTRAFSDLQPEELRDLLFFLTEFRKEYKIPEDVLIYSQEVPIDALEIKSEEKISEILLGGVDKYIDLNYPKKSLPPVLAVRGENRLIIMYGEMSAIEAYIRKQPLRVLTVDIGERDPFKMFRLNEFAPVFLVPAIEDMMEVEEKKVKGNKKGEEEK